MFDSLVGTKEFLGTQYYWWDLTGVKLGLAITIYFRCLYGLYGRKIIKYTVIYGAHIRFWPVPSIFFNQQAHASHKQPYVAFDWKGSQADDRKL
jgi:hypothetical protein